MYEVKVNNNPNRFYDATEVIGAIPELSREAVEKFLKDYAAKGPRYAGAEIVDFEVDEDHKGYADCAIMVQGRMECFDIAPK